MDGKQISLKVHEVADKGLLELVLVDSDGDTTVLGATQRGRHAADELCDILQDNIEQVQDALGDMLIG